VGVGRRERDGGGVGAERGPAEEGEVAGREGREGEGDGGLRRLGGGCEEEQEEEGRGGGGLEVVAVVEERGWWSHGREREGGRGAEPCWKF